MEIRGDLPVSTLVWQPRPGAWVMTVVTKATFTLEPGRLSLAQDQEPVYEADSHWDDDSQRSLSVASDLAPTKPRAEVMVVGHAFAPDAKPVRSLVARMSVEGLDKAIELWGDRSVGPDGTVYEGAPFVRMRMVYERAAAGAWNPVGVRSATRDAYGRHALPNVYALGRGAEARDPIDPAGFGPLAPIWPTRRDRLRYHAPFFDNPGWTEQPLPDDVDMSFFHAAPPDQQLDAIPDDAKLLFENMHKQHPVLRASLPGLKPKASYRRRGDKKGLAMRADTLWVDTDRAILTIAWRGQIPLEARDEQLKIRVDVEGQRPSWRTAQHEVTSTRATITNEDLQEPGETTMTTRPRAATHLPTKSGDPVLPFATMKPRGGDGARKGSPATVAMPAMPFQAEPTSSGKGLPFSGASPSTPPSPPGHEAPWSASAFPPSPAPPAVAPAPPPPPANAYVPAPAVAAPAAPAVPQGMSVAAAYVAAAAVSDPTRATGEPKAWAPVSAPPPPAPVHASSAALAGLVGASNAAADPRARTGTGAAVPAFTGDVLQLLWFDPEAAPRIRRRPEWKKILDQMEETPFDPEVDQPGLSDEPAEIEDRREVFEILARGTPAGEDGVDNALLAAVRPDGRFAPQLLLLAGEARFDFDEVETLKATVSTAAPFTATEEELKAAVERAASYLATPDLLASSEVAQSLTAKIREAFGKAASRPVAATFLDDQTERVLLERRAYQKRDVFGAPHLRSQFFFAGSASGIPTYFPESLAKKLPLFRRLRVKLLVETHFQADQYESHAAALRAAAVARVVR